MEHHNQVAEIVNICTEFGLESIGSNWEMLQQVVENDRAKVRFPDETCDDESMGHCRGWLTTEDSGDRCSQPK